MLKLNIRHGMIIEKVRELYSFRQSKRLEIDICFVTQKEQFTKK